jgi:hypothetical protein
VIEPRVYRAAFIPALLVAVLAAFSLQSRPGPLPQGLAADVLFDGNQAAAAAMSLSQRQRDRRAGSFGDRATAGEVADSLSSRGFRVERNGFSEAGKDLVNVIARRAGRSRRQIVIVAPRDASRVPDLVGSASDTAALLELGRVFEGRPTVKTLVLASIDGSTIGDVGAEKLADELGDPGLIDAVLVLSDLGSPRRHGPLIVPWSNDSNRAGIGLQRTIADSIRQELDQPVGSVGAFGQLARLAFPLGIGPQGVLLARGFESVRISGSGELPPSGGEAEIDRDELGGLGRATLRTATALDQGKPPEHGPDSYVIAVSQVLPGWVLELLALALLLPVLVASIDAFARARRRHEAVAPWLRWLALWVGPLVVGLVLAELLALAGATPDPPAAPPAPSDYALDGGAVAVLLGIALVVGASWWTARFIALRAQPVLRDPSSPGAAVALSLTLSLTVLVLWLLNPYTALIVVPAVHLWMLATLADPAPPARTRALFVALGALPPALVALYWLVALSLNPVSGLWYALLLVLGGGIGLGTALIGCLLLGSLAAVLAIARVRRGEPPEAPAEGPPVYGPGSYAGPGSLGGTESALGR